MDNWEQLNCSLINTSWAFEIQLEWMIQVKGREAEGIWREVQEDYFGPEKRNPEIRISMEKPIWKEAGNGVFSLIEKNKWWFGGISIGKEGDTSVEYQIFFFFFFLMMRLISLLTCVVLSPLVRCYPSKSSPVLAFRGTASCQRKKWDSRWWPWGLEGIWNNIESNPVMYRWWNRPGKEEIYRRSIIGECPPWNLSFYMDLPHLIICQNSLLVDNFSGRKIFCGTRAKGDK